MDWRSQIDNWIWFAAGVIVVVIGVKLDVAPIIPAAGICWEKAREKNGKV